MNNGIDYSIIDSKSFDYKTKFMENVTNANLMKQNVKIAVPLKYLRNFWKAWAIPLINCKMSLILTWSKNCVLTSKSTRAANYENNPMVYRVDGTVNTKFVITGTRLNVSVVTLWNKDDDKILDHFKTEFKRNIKSKKYRSEMTK